MAVGLVPVSPQVVHVDAMLRWAVALRAEEAETKSHASEAKMREPHSSTRNGLSGGKTN